MAISQNTGGAEPKANRLRWFQYRLRTVLVLVTVIAVLLVAWRTYVEPYRRQQATVKLLSKLHARVVTGPAPGWVARILGDHCQNVLSIDVAKRDPAEYLEAVAALPALSTLVVGGPKFGDDELRRLHQLRSLRVLELDSTKVTAAALAGTRRALPLAKVYRVPWRTVAKLERAGAYAKYGEHFAQHAVIALDVWPDRGEGSMSFSDSDLALVKSLPTIESIRLNSTQVTDKGMEYLRGLSNLKDLTLVDMRVTDKGLEHLKGLRHLKQLTLIAIPVTDKGLACLTALSNLTDLTLYSTQVTDEGLGLLKQLPHLKHLSLAGERIGDPGLEHLRKLTRLEQLRLPGMVTDAGVAHLKKLTRLTLLDLSGTKVTDLGLAHLQQLTRLDELHLDRTRITSEGLIHLRPLLRLRYLFLSGIEITDVGAGHLNALPKLQGVIMDDCLVSERTLESLSQLTRLESLTMFNSWGFSEEAMEKLQIALPSTSVDYGYVHD